MTRREKPEEPKDEPKEEPKDEPKEEPKDEPKEEPKDEPKEEPKDEPKEEPKDEQEILLCSTNETTSSGKTHYIPQTGDEITGNYIYLAYATIITVTMGAIVLIWKKPEEEEGLA